MRLKTGNRARLYVLPILKIFIPIIIMSIISNPVMAEISVYLNSYNATTQVVTIQVQNDGDNPLTNVKYQVELKKEKFSEMENLVESLPQLSSAIFFKVLKPGKYKIKIYSETEKTEKLLDLPTTRDLPSPLSDYEFEIVKVELIKKQEELKRRKAESALNKTISLPIVPQVPIGIKTLVDPIPSRTKKYFLIIVLIITTFVTLIFLIIRRKRSYT